MPGYVCSNPPSRLLTYPPHAHDLRRPPPTLGVCHEARASPRPPELALTRVSRSSPSSRGHTRIRKRCPHAPSAAHPSYPSDSWLSFNLHKKYRISELYNRSASIQYYRYSKVAMRVVIHKEGLAM